MVSIFVHSLVCMLIIVQTPTLFLQQSRCELSAWRVSLLRWIEDILTICLVCFLALHAVGALLPCSQLTFIFGPLVTNVHPLWISNLNGSITCFKLSLLQWTSEMLFQITLRIQEATIVISYFSMQFWVLTIIFYLHLPLMSVVHRLVEQEFCFTSFLANLGSSN